MSASDLLYLAILATMGISWTIVYLLIIYRSFKDKQCGMPALALAFNLCWEFLYSFVFTGSSNSIQMWVNRTWFLFDVVIFAAHLLYTKAYWPKENRKYFYPFTLFIVVAAYVFLYLFHLDIGETAITYSAYLMNVLISSSFISMLLKQNNLNGQSFGIAFFKMLGTTAATIVLFQRYSSFLQFLGILCFVLDVVYIFMIVNRYKKENLQLITRKAIR